MQTTLLKENVPLVRFGSLVYKEMLLKILMEAVQTRRAGKCSMTSVRSTAASSFTESEIYERVGEVRCTKCKLLCKSVQGCKAAMVSRVKLTWLLCRSSLRGWNIWVTLLTELQYPIEMESVENTFPSLSLSLSVLHSLLDYCLLKKRPILGQ